MAVVAVADRADAFHGDYLECRAMAKLSLKIEQYHAKEAGCDNATIRLHRHTRHNTDSQAHSRASSARIAAAGYAESRMNVVAPKISKSGKNGYLDTSQVGTNSCFLYTYIVISSF